MKLTAEKFTRSVVLLTMLLLVTGAFAGEISKQEFTIKVNADEKKLELTITEEKKGEESNYKFKLTNKDDDKSSDFTVEPFTQDEFNNKLEAALKDASSLTVADGGRYVDSLHGKSKSELFLLVQIAVNFAKDDLGAIAGYFKQYSTVTATKTRNGPAVNPNTLVANAKAKVSNLQKTAGEKLQALEAAKSALVTKQQERQRRQETQKKWQDKLANAPNDAELAEIAKAAEQDLNKATANVTAAELAVTTANDNYKQDTTALAQAMAKANAVKVKQGTDTVIFFAPREIYHKCVSEKVINASRTGFEPAFSKIFKVKKRYLRQYAAELNVGAITVEPIAKSDFNSKLSTDGKKVQFTAHLHASATGPSQEQKEIKISKVTIEFDEGYLKHIIVKTEDVNGDNKPDEFKNNFPIPITAFRDNERLGKYFLYNRLFSDAKSWKITLGDVFNYTPEPANTRLDFSPGDQTQTFLPREDYYVLRKAPTRELFKARVYTDFMGIPENNANGLVQTEVDRQFNLLTKRYFNNRTVRWVNTGLFQWILPFAKLSKIETKERFLPLESQSYIYNGSIKTRRYTTPVKLMNYEHFSFGFKLNFALLHFPTIKSTFFINGFTACGLTTAQDSAREIKDNSIVVADKKPDRFEAIHLRFAPEIVWRIGGDERVFFDITYSFNWNLMFNDKVLLVYDKNDYLRKRSIDSRYPVGMVSGQLTIRPSSLVPANKDKNLPDRGDIFVRGAYNYSWNNPKDNFAQVQVGYSFYILRTALK